MSRKFGKWNAIREMYFRKWIRELEAEYLSRYIRYCRKQKVEPNFKTGYYGYLIFMSRKDPE